MADTTMIPGYADNTRVMLAKMRQIRFSPPFDRLTDGEFQRIVEDAESWIAKAESIQDQAILGGAAVEAYRYRCDRARELIRGSYDGLFVPVGEAHVGQQRRKAKMPRRPPAEIDACIDAALAKPGTAKERWAHLPGLLEQAGFIVQEVQTDAGQLAIVVDADKPFKLSLKAFQNQLTKKKSRQPG